MPKIKVDDINIYYEIHGNGYPLVMTIPYSIEWWDPTIIDLLSKYFTVLIFDGRGVGKTNYIDLDYTFKTLVDDTIGLLDALNIEQAHFFGISGAGILVQEIAISYPERVNKLVLCSTQCMGGKAILPSPEIMEIIGKTSLAFNSEKQVRELVPYILTQKFIKNNPVKVEEFIQVILKNPLSEESAKYRIRASLKFSPSNRLKNIKSKTLVMHGKKDIIVVPENAEILAKLIPGAKLVFFEKSAHSISAEEPELFIKTIIEFLY
ncbi:MAG: alpha/beta fold hydrolase [Candidatus Odinarchaeota archaeon]